MSQIVQTDMGEAGGFEDFVVDGRDGVWAVHPQRYSGEEEHHQHTPFIRFLEVRAYVLRVQYVHLLHRTSHAVVKHHMEAPDVTRAHAGVAALGYPESPTNAQHGVNQW